MPLESPYPALYSPSWHLPFLNIYHFTYVLYLWLIVHCPLLEYYFHKGRDHFFFVSQTPRTVPLHNGSQWIFVAWMNQFYQYSIFMLYFVLFSPILSLFASIWVDRECNPKTSTSFLVYILLHSSISAALQQNPVYMACYPPRRSYWLVHILLLLPEKAWIDVQRIHCGSLEHVRATGQVNSSLDQIYWKLFNILIILSGYSLFFLWGNRLWAFESDFLPSQIPW